MSTRRVLLLPSGGDRFELRVEDGAYKLVSTSVHNIEEFSDPFVLKTLVHDSPDEVTGDPEILRRIESRFKDERRADDAIALALERLTQGHQSVTTSPGIKAGLPPIMAGAAKGGLTDGGDVPAPGDGGSDER